MGAVLKYFIDADHRNKRIYERLGNYRQYLKNPFKLYYKRKAELKMRELCSSPELQGIECRISNYEGEYAKYKNFRRYIKMNLRRIYELGLHRQKGLEILDIGSGAGFFSYLAKHFGHAPQGLDLPSVEIFNILIKEFRVPRWEYRIEPQTPISCNGGRRFDLIVAYAICFYISEEGIWTSDDWNFFLNDIKENLIKPGGRMHLWFNDYPHGDYEDVKAKISNTDFRMEVGHKTIDIYF